MTAATAATPAAPGVGIRSLLRIPDYRRLWTAQAISDLGDSLTSLSLLLLVNALTGSTAALALMAIVLAVPQVVFGVAAGALVDRWDRRRIMLVSDLSRAGIVLGFVLVRSADDLWILYLLGFIQATVGTFFTPARTALTPHVVPAEGLLAANSLAQMTRLIAGVLGAAGAGFLMTMAGTAWPAFVVDSLTFLLSFALVLRVSASAGAVSAARVGRPGAGGVLRDSLDGVRIAARSRLLSGTLLSAALVMLGLGAVNVLFVPLLVDVLEVPPVWFGAVELAQASSMVLSALLVAALFNRARPTTVVVGGLVAVGVIIAVVGTVSAVWQLLVLMFVLGWAVAPVQASLVTIIQQGSTDAVRGRIASLFSVLTGATSVLSMAFAGIAGDRLGVREVFFLAGLLGLASAAVAIVFYRGARLPTADEADLAASDRPRGADAMGSAGA